ncbi:MAG: hypothetical protein L6Q54_01570 [Leptospiraceae bacterium]|nr:hypothetical protein [Leptospiraceae bacterium]MCK6379927.1 hypothetical protein [Leptospiraceae bacterium]NUM42494.1 hypothetical protein [Leptospiraceae bacterium]
MKRFFYFDKFPFFFFILLIFINFSLFSHPIKKDGLVFETYSKENFTIHHRGKKKAIESLTSELLIFQNQVLPTYFSNLPPKIVIYLYRNTTEYNSKKNTQHETYAHFEPKSKELFSFVDSGTGPIFHELVHLYLSLQSISNNRILWFEEGFSSFFESPKKDNFGNYIFDEPNWRMESIKGKWTDLSTFIKTIDLRENHSKAQARILFLWLFKKNILPQFIKTYHENLDFDNSGAEALQEVTGTQIDEINIEMKKFKEELENSSSSKSVK